MKEQKKVLVPEMERGYYMKFIHRINKNIILNKFEEQFDFSQLHDIMKSYSYDILLLKAPYHILGDLTVSFEVLRAELRSLFINIRDDFAQMSYEVHMHGKGAVVSYTLPIIISSDIIPSLNGDRLTASLTIQQIFNFLESYDSEYWNRQKQNVVEYFNKFVMRTYNILKVIEGVN